MNGLLGLLERLWRRLDIVADDPEYVEREWVSMMQLALLESAQTSVRSTAPDCQPAPDTAGDWCINGREPALVVSRATAARRS